MNFQLLSFKYLPLLCFVLTPSFSFNLTDKIKHSCILLAEHRTHTKLFTYISLVSGWIIKVTVAVRALYYCLSAAEAVNRRCAPAQLILVIIISQFTCSAGWEPHLTSCHTYSSNDSTLLCCALHNYLGKDHKCIRHYRKLSMSCKLGPLNVSSLPWLILEFTLWSSPHFTITTHRARGGIGVFFFFLTSR